MVVEGEEWLPADWTAKFKVEKNGRKIKYYMNVRTGQKFCSKEDLLRYVKMKRTQLDEPHPTNAHGKRLLENSSSRLVAKENNRGKRHSENRRTRLLSKENNHEYSRDTSHSGNSITELEAKENNHENSSMKPVAKENNHENSYGKRHSENSSTEPVAEENTQPECLPDGWVVDLRTRKSGSAMGRQYKVYIEPLTGCKFFSMPEVLRHLESVKNRNSECERKTKHTERSKCEDAQKVSTKTERKIAERVVVEKSAVDDLPPGWIKETKIKKTARGIRKDPFYTDPVSGYVFVSKKDVFRYLETGAISKYAFKVRKIGTDDAELITEEALPSTDAKRQKIEHTATRKRLFPVKESSDVCSSAVLKTEVLKKRRGKEVSAETGLAGASTAEISPEQTAKMAIDEGTETKEISSLSGSALPKFRGSKRNKGKMVFNDNGSVSTPVIDSLQEQRLLQSHIECSNGKNDTTKSVREKKFFPLRSSKRLAGLEPELVSNSVTVEQAPKNVATESCKSKAIPSAYLTSTGLVDEVSQHLNAGLVPELANHVSSDVTILSSGEPSNKFKSSGSQAIPGEQLQKFKFAETYDGKSEQHVSLYFGDSYLDPCLESAFKALRGELLVNYNPDNRPVLNPAADILQERSMQMTEGEKSSSGKTQKNSMQLKNKQELSLPRRSSKRIAGFEPEMVASCGPLKQAPRNVTTESCKSKGILAAGLTSSGLVDEVSLQLKTGPVLALPNRASAVLGLAKRVSSEVNIPSSGELSNKIKSSRNLAITGGQSAEANGDKSEPHASLSFGGSYLNPCKAMMGETLVDSVPDNEPVSTTAADILLQGTKVEKSSNKKTRINSMKSKNKQEIHLPRRFSKRLSGLEPELVSNSDASEQACGNATIESCKSEAPTCEKTDPRGPEDGASQQDEAGHETMLAQHDCTDTSTLLLEETSDRSIKPLEAQTVSEKPSQKLENEKQEQPQNLENEKQEEQPQNLENERMDNENPDSQILFPFGDSWSDPCLEFAFKTLTGAIPVDENLAIQDYFQHQLDPSNSQKDDSSALLDFGPISTYQTDVSLHSDALEKQLAPPPQQQLPANPFPPPGNVSVPSCSSIDLNRLA